MMPLHVLLPVASGVLQAAVVQVGVPQHALCAVKHKYGIAVHHPLVLL